MFGHLFGVVAPVFGVIVVGWVLSRVRRVDLATLTDVVIYAAAPALVFHSLATQSLDGGTMLAVGGGGIFESLVCGAAAWIAFRTLRVRARGLILASMYPNAGNLGLPLALFAFGPEGLAAAVVVFCVGLLFYFSFGVMIVSGSMNPAEALKMPILHAGIFGVASALTDVVPPQPVMDGLELLGGGAVPLMLLSLGIRMGRVRLRRVGLALMTVGLRIVPGLAAGIVWVTVVGLEGPERGVVLITGVLPPAVMNFVFAEAYDQQSEEVASAIMIGTIVSILVIPIVLAFVV
jgi:predicted permease